MKVFDCTRALLERQHLLHPRGARPTDPGRDPIQRALVCLRRLNYDEYLEACAEFQRDTLPGGPFIPPSAGTYSFFPSSYDESK